MSLVHVAIQLSQAAAPLVSFTRLEHAQVRRSAAAADPAAHASDAPGRTGVGVMSMVHRSMLHLQDGAICMS